jgi:hypothetical protein
VKRILLAGGAVIAAGLLAGCSESRIKASADSTAPPPEIEHRVADQAAKTTVGQRFASAALDDRQLGGVRGGMSTGSGMVVNFSFQEATYVNHNLTQSIIVPTMTISPTSTSASTATMTAGGPGVVGVGTTATHVQVGTPSQIVQSVVNSGLTSVVSSLAGGGVTNHISNAANNQLVQQVITANIGITGLGQAIQQGVASTVMSRVQAATAQFR